MSSLDCNDRVLASVPRIGTRRERILLVTEELSGLNSSGGIGAAFRELALVLARSQAAVDILYLPSEPVVDEKLDQVKLWYASAGVSILTLEVSDYVNGPLSAEARSYAVSKWIRSRELSYSIIHFHDYKGLGYFTIAAKKFGLLSPRTQLVVQTHGPTRWALEANLAFFIHEDQLKIDFMEKKSLEWCDWVVSPSAYLLQWMRESGYVLPQMGDKVRIIKNACSEIAFNAATARSVASNAAHGRSKSVVMFGRHEERKGLVTFCDALDLIAVDLESLGASVTFLGGLGSAVGQPSLAYLMERSERWNFPIHLRTGFTRDEAARHLLSMPSPVCVIPSPHENSPYTVLESIMLGLPTISSDAGGGPELFRGGYSGLVRIAPEPLAKKILEAVVAGIGLPEPAESAGQIDAAWLSFHQELSSFSLESTAVQEDVKSAGWNPLVTVGITHHERPEKLIDAVLSIARQTYRNIELIVVDDGSRAESTLEMLEAVEVLVERIGGRLIKRENGYLGAARNSVLSVASGKYVVFLDDDDIARPHMVERLVNAIESSGLACVNCLNAYMSESERGEFVSVHSERGKPSPKPTYVPVGGPLSLGPLQNVFGGATAIFDLAAVRSLGGYSELRGVGHEDYELFLRLAQAGHSIGVLPDVLYYYEIGRPSMLTRTSLARNFKRCFDALEFDRADWISDFASLVVGKQTSVDAHNRQYWLYGQRASADELRALMIAVGRRERLELAFSVCEKEGRERFASVIASDLSSTPHASPIVESRRLQIGGVRMSIPRGGASWVSRQIFSAKLAFSLGDEQSAFGAVEDVLLTEDKFQHQDRTELVALLASNGCGSISIDARVAVLDLLVASGRTGQVELRVAAAAFDGLSSEGVARALTKFGMDIEEAEYLATHPDVASAVAAGNFSSGVAHYMGFGIKEGRTGFARLNWIVRALGLSGAAGALQAVMLAIVPESRPESPRVL